MKMPREVAISSPRSSREAVAKAGGDNIRRRICSLWAAENSGALHRGEFAAFQAAVNWGLNL